MRRTGPFVIVILALAVLSLAQDQPSQPTPPPGHHHEAGTSHLNMSEMHKQHMAAMKADVDKMNASLELMKTNVAKISDPNEKARWQTNIDLWTALVGHMEQMMKHMEEMGPGMGMMHHGMGDHPARPPAEKKPQ